MKKLISLELKRYFKNAITLITLALILAMYITQCLPKKWYWYGEPMNETQFIYTKMVEDYSKGYTEELKIDDHILCEKNQYSNQAKDFLLKSIQQMNPEYPKKKISTEITFDITPEKFQTIMNELNQKLGGKSYYADSIRPILYNVYTVNAFHINDALDISQKISAMEQYLGYIEKEQWYQKYNNLVLKKIKLTDNELQYLSGVHTEMLNLKNEKDIGNLFDLYNSYDLYFIDIDNKLGGNTAFSTRYRQVVFNFRNGWEDELKYYESIKNDEKVTNAYARYYSDYMVLLAGILPAVFGAFRLIEERRFKMHEFVYSKPIKSAKFVLTQYFSIVMLFGIFFYLIAGVSTVLFYKFGLTYNLSVDNLAFFKYITFWVMPTVLFTTALSMFLSLLLNSGIIVIMIQLVIFFISAQPLIGSYKFYRPIIRYNQIGDINIFRSNLHSIILNRIWISAISIVLLGISIKLYSVVRKNGSLLEYLTNRFNVNKER